MSAPPASPRTPASPSPASPVAAPSPAPGSPATTDVFLSYAWGDEHPRRGSGVRSLQQRAHAVAAKLRAAGCSVWLDTERMGAAAQGGGGLATAMVAGIEGCGAFVCCMSAAYAASRNCKAEFIFALNKKKRILFANVGEAPDWAPTGLSGDDAWLLLRLEDKLWADCRTQAALDGRDGVAVLLGELGPAAAAAAARAATGGGSGGGGAAAAAPAPAALKPIAWAELTDPGPELGRGAFGFVRPYSYHGTRVAVKELSGLSALLGSQAEVDAFTREASLQASLQHDHVVRVLGIAIDASPAARRYGLVMQRGEGGLDACLASLAPRTRLEFARQIAAGLAYMHAQGVVHADVKPANVLVLPGGVSVALTDFGFAAAKLAASQSSSAGGGKGAGTAAFKAPELFERDEDGNFAHGASKASDVFSFAVMAFCLLAGVAAPYPVSDPKTGKNISIDFRVPKGMRPTDFRPLPAELPAPLVTLVAACWAGAPAARPTMVAVRDGIDRLLSEARGDDDGAISPARFRGAASGGAAAGGGSSDPAASPVSSPIAAEAAETRLRAEAELEAAAAAEINTTKLRAQFEAAKLRDQLAAAEAREAGRREAAEATERKTVAERKAAADAAECKAAAEAVERKAAAEAAERKAEAEAAERKAEAEAAERKAAAEAAGRKAAVLELSGADVAPARAIALLRGFPGDLEVSRATARALAAAADTGEGDQRLVYSASRRACVEAGAPSALVALAGSEAVRRNAEAARVVALAMRNLARADEGRNALLAEGAAQPVVALASAVAVRGNTGAAQYVAWAIVSASARTARPSCSRAERRPRSLQLQARASSQEAPGQWSRSQRPWPTSAPTAQTVRPSCSRAAQRPRLSCSRARASSRAAPARRSRSRRQLST